MQARGGHREPKKKRKEKEGKLEDKPAKPWRPVSEQEIVDGAR
jgi:hypothetical protein